MDVLEHEGRTLVEELASVLRSLSEGVEQSALLLSARITRTLYPAFFRAS